jgi:DNA helicase-2/ATP-dependent DNA helicase PcrA
MTEQQALSAEQQQAALMVAVPICILAGAGSGKTRVITHRIAHLVKHMGVEPRSILGLTFTNKAAREMRERVERLLPYQGNDVMLGTFHGMAARFLRYYGDVVGISKDFLIYDEDDATRLVKKILRERYDLSKDELSAEVKKIMRFRDAEKLAAEKTASSERAEHILQLYQERLTKMGALDFSGLLLKFQELLQNEEGLRIIGGRVRHLLVDEYQDTNAIQSNIVHILAKQADTVAIVGDDDQSIYGWRGASAHYMQKFLTDFSGAQLFRLEDNYRSTKPILDAANALISNNKERLGKTLRAISGDGPLLRLSKHYRDNQEASWVIEQSMRLFEQHGAKFDIAVLMRTNAQSRPLEEALHKARLPYRMVGGMRFYDRKEIKDILAALRSVIYHNSDVDLLRVLDSLSLGIGKKTQEVLSHYAGNNGLSFFETMLNDGYQEAALGNTRSKKKIADFVKKLTEMRAEMVQTLPDGEVKILRADEALIYVIDRFGIAAKLEQKNDDESEARLENIEQLVQAAVSFVEEADSLGMPTDAQAFLENVTLISKDESVSESNASNMGTITLMTLHAAKGLEFDGVFLVGLEEGVLPHSRSLHGTDEVKRNSALEEERRLLYVGITRAKKRLFLSYCQERFLHGKTSISAPSRFLKEIPRENFDLGDRYLMEHLRSGSATTIAQEKGWSSSTRIVSKPKVETKSDASYHIEYEDDHLHSQSQAGFKVGARVYHSTYRQGRIVSLGGAGKMMRGQIKFDDDGLMRMIMVSHLRLL